MWPVGQLEKMDTSLGVTDGEAAVGASRYMRRKLRIEPTTRVEKTKSSSFRPKLGRHDMSPMMHALRPTSSSISTLNGNCGSAATLDFHPLRKRPNTPTTAEDEDELSELLPSPSPPPPPPLRPPVPLLPLPPAVEALLTILFKFCRWTQWILILEGCVEGNGRDKEGVNGGRRWQWVLWWNAEQERFKWRCATLITIVVFFQ